MPPNAAHHAPARNLRVLNSHRVGGRVHWLVRVHDWGSAQLPRTRRTRSDASPATPGEG
jgi:hypothetical protein